MSKVEDEDEYAIIDNVGRLCSQVGQALDLRVRGVRGPDDCVLLAVGTGARRINAAIHPQLRCVLVTMKNDSYLQTIAKSMTFYIL